MPVISPDVAPATHPSWQEVIQQAYGTLATEVVTPTPMDVLEGSVPNDLRGTLFRNGPGRQERGGVRYGHPFDGDGYVQRIAFTDEGVHVQGRFVQTAGFVAEEARRRWG